MLTGAAGLGGSKVGWDKSGIEGVETGCVGVNPVCTGSYVGAGAGVNDGTADTGNPGSPGAESGGAPVTPPIDIIGTIGGGEMFSETGLGAATGSGWTG